MVELQGVDNWEDKHFFAFILDKVLAIKNKRNQLKIKGIKIYSSKQSMTSSAGSLVKLHIFQIKRSLTLDEKWHHGREHS